MKLTICRVDIKNLHMPVSVINSVHQRVFTYQSDVQLPPDGIAILCVRMPEGITTNGVNRPSERPSGPRRNSLD